MLKKISVIFLILVLSLSLISWDSSPIVNDGDVPFTVGDQPITETNKQVNGRIQQFYVDDQIDLNGTDLISTYVSSNDASDCIVELYEGSSESRLIPILGEYLEYTSLAACLFYKDESFIGLRTVVLDERDNQSHIVSEAESLLGNDIDESVYASVVNCIEFGPDFEIIGLAYVDHGFCRVYPIGPVDGNRKIVFFDEGVAKDFGYIDNFSSIDEGQKAFEDYWVFREQTITDIPIFRWKTEYFYPGGALSHYKAYALGDKEENQFLHDSDWNIVIPLLDDDGNEGSHVMHLLYDNDVLIAEIVLCDTDDAPISVYQRVSEKDESTGRYLGLSEIKYCSDIEGGLSKTKDFSQIKGVCFNGTKYTLIYESDNLGISDFLSSNLELVIFITCCFVIVVSGVTIYCMIHKKRKSKTVSDENNE